MILEAKRKAAKKVPKLEKQKKTKRKTSPLDFLEEFINET